MGGAKRDLQSRALAQGGTGSGRGGSTGGGRGGGLGKERLAGSCGKALADEALSKNDPAVDELRLRRKMSHTVIREEKNAHGLPRVAHDERRWIQRRHFQHVRLGLRPEQLWNKGVVGGRGKRREGARRDGRESTRQFGSIMPSPYPAKERHLETQKDRHAGAYA